jgi:hypothetical protein
LQDGGNGRRAVLVADFERRGREAVGDQQQVDIFAQHEFVAEAAHAVRVGLAVADEDLHRVLLAADLDARP